MKNILKLQVYAGLFLCGLLITTPANALIQRSFVNLGFEDIQISTVTTGCRVYASQGKSVPGWLTTHPSYSGTGRVSCSGTVSSAIDTTTSAPIIEIWKGPRENVDGVNGTHQFAELNAEVASSLYQKVCLITGETFDWQFYHRGRDGTDTMKFTLGGNIPANGGVVSGGVLVKEASTGNTAWQKYSGTQNVSLSASGDQFIGFTAVGGTTKGNFIDEIQVTLKPVVEFSAGTFTAKETDGATATSIKVIIVGNITTALPLTFKVNSASTAKLGDDYKINGGVSDTFTKTVAVGNYGTGYTLEIPVEIINNDIVQGDRFFKLNMVEDKSKFNLLSSNQCGDPGNSLATYNISDDDIGIVLKKEWKNAIVGDKAKLQTKGGTTGSNNADYLTVANTANKTEETPIAVVAVDAVRTLHEVLDATNAGVYKASDWQCDGGQLSGNVLKTLTADLGKVIRCSVMNQRYEAFRGKVIEDNSGTTGIAGNAYNGVQNTGESGIAGSLIELKDCSGSPVIATTRTNANGDFEILTVQDIYAGRNDICLIQNDLAGYSSVSANQQPAGGAVLDSTTFNQFKVTKPTNPKNHEGFLFGDAQLQLILTQNGQKNIAAGDVVEYPHEVISKSVHKLGSLSPSNLQQPATGQAWQSVVYYDANCNGAVDSGEKQYDAALQSAPLSAPILPDQKICLVQRVISPSSAKSGDSLSAQFAVKHTPTVNGGSEKLSNTVRDITAVGSAGLDLVKNVREVKSCPSTVVDTAAFVKTNTLTKVQNQASYLEYQISYANNSAKKLVDVTLKDAVPLGTSLKSMCTGSSCSAVNSNTPLNWSIGGGLAPHATGTVGFCVQVQ